MYQFVMQIDGAPLSGKSNLAARIALAEAKRGEIVAVYAPEDQHCYLERITALVLDKRMAETTKEDFACVAKKISKFPGRIFAGHLCSDLDPVAWLERTIKETGATRFVLDGVEHLCTLTVPYPRFPLAELENLGKRYGTVFILISLASKEGAKCKGVLDGYPVPSIFVGGPIAALLGEPFRPLGLKPCRAAAGEW